MTHKSPRGLHICVACICGFHHVGKAHTTEQGRPCNCVCQERDFSIFCAETRHLAEMQHAVQPSRNRQGAA